MLLFNSEESFVGARRKRQSYQEKTETRSRIKTGYKRLLDYLRYNQSACGHLPTTSIRHCQSLIPAGRPINSPIISAAFSEGRYIIRVPYQSRRVEAALALHVLFSFYELQRKEILSTDRTPIVCVIPVSVASSNIRFAACFRRCLVIDMHRILASASIKVWRIVSPASH